MLDSSPIPAPSPKKLKRTASVASLPSPPPSVDHLKKRSAAHRYSNNNSGSSGSESEEEVEVQEGEILGRKLLFPSVPSALPVVADSDDPFLSTPVPSNARDQLAADAAKSPLATRAKLPVSPPPSRRTVKAPIAPLKTCEQPWKCTASDFPVRDPENNPFLSNSPPKPRRARSPREPREPQTMTYVFKGVKTAFPNPNYNLPDSAYERSRLPLDHPEYSPPPTYAPRRLFPEAYADDADDEEDDEHESVDGTDVDSRSLDMRPSMSQVFVDEAGNPLPDSGPEGIRGKTLDAYEIGRMAVGPLRGRG